MICLQLVLSKKLRNENDFEQALIFYCSSLQPNNFDFRIFFVLCIFKLYFILIYINKPHR